MEATAVDHEEFCDPCARRGMMVMATHDAPRPEGAWAFHCDACLYRLPAELRAMAVPLVVVS